MLLRNWEEVYFTSEMETFFMASNLLNEQGISYKTDTVNNQLRLSMNHSVTRVPLYAGTAT